jgi:hypothetical protein
MTTVRQVKKAMQPLLKRNPDLALVGRFVVIKPVHHILRGIYIDASSVAWQFIPIWSINFLFGPSVAFDRIWGRQVYPSGKVLWRGDDPATYKELSDEIEQNVLPLLRQVQSIDDFAAFNSKERFNGQQLELFDYLKIYVDIARGDFNSALKASKHMKTTGRHSSDVPNIFNEITNTLHPMLVANDRSGLAQILREWEQGQIKHRKLEHLWEPTPFTFEVQSV